MGLAIIGQHPALQDMIEKARRLAAVSRPALICGERGTGKELVARLIHEAGPRQRKPFIAINCGAANGELISSEIFGHEKGAFTGASERRLGKLEQANGGTLFLDEIGNMPASFQEKLLRVLECQEFERVGGSTTIKVDVRVVAATNADLKAMAGSGDFRADLYDRISFAVLQVPALRERRSDIPVLIDHFAKRLAEEMPGMEWRRFSALTLDEMVNYYWPGNVRQLRNVVEHLYIMGDGAGNEIQPSELPREIAAIEPQGGTYDERLQSFEQSLILGSLKDKNYNQKEAAASLGLSYDRFRHIMRRLNLKAKLD